MASSSKPTSPPPPPPPTPGIGRPETSGGNSGEHKSPLAKLLAA